MSPAIALSLHCYHTTEILLYRLSIPCMTLMSIKQQRKNKDGNCIKLTDLRHERSDSKVMWRTLIASTKYDPHAVDAWSSSDPADEVPTLKMLRCPFRFQEKIISHCIDITSSGKKLEAVNSRKYQRVNFIKGGVSPNILVFQVYEDRTF